TGPKSPGNDSSHVRKKRKKGSGRFRRRFEIRGREDGLSSFISLLFEIDAGSRFFCYLAEAPKSEPCPSFNSSVGIFPPLSASKVSCIRLPEAFACCRVIRFISSCTTLKSLTKLRYDSSLASGSGARRMADG